MATKAELEARLEQVERLVAKLQRRLSAAAMHADDFQNRIVDDLDVAARHLARIAVAEAAGLTAHPGGAIEKWHKDVDGFCNNVRHSASRPLKKQQRNRRYRLISEAFFEVDLAVSCRTGYDEAQEAIKESGLSPQRWDSIKDYVLLKVNQDLWPLVLTKLADVGLDTSKIKTPELQY